MVRLRRILKDFRETGALNSLIALWGFVDDTTFLTKAGAVGVLYRLQGVDFECLAHPQRQVMAHRFEQALRQLDESFRVYQYLLKRPAPVVTAAAHAHPVVHEALTRRTAQFAATREALFELELYLVEHHEVQLQLEQRLACRGELGGAARERLVHHRMRMRRGRHHRGRPLEQVLVHTERLVELAERLLEAMGHHLALRMVETLEVDALQAIEDADGAGLGEERRVIHEAPQRDETVQGTGLAIVLENAADAYHADHLTSITKGACFAAS